MTASLRHAALLAARERSVLAPLLALLFVLLGVYAYKPNDVGPTWELTALLTAPIVAWLRIAVARAEPEAQRLVRVAAAGGARRAWVQDTGAAVLVALLVVAAMLIYPLATHSFDRAVRASDLTAAGLDHLAAAAFGLALGRLASPPVSGRAATSLLLVAGALIGAAALTPGAAIYAGAAVLVELAAHALERRAG